METLIFSIIVAIAVGYIIASYFAKKRYDKVVDVYNTELNDLQKEHDNQLTEIVNKNNMSRESLVHNYEKTIRDLRSEVTKHKTPKCSCGRFKKRGKIKCAKCEEEILDKKVQE